MAATDFERQLDKIRKIDFEAQAEERILEQVTEERTKTLSTLVGEAWMAKTFPEKYASNIDPLLTKKFKTKAGLSSIRLEKLLLELDKVDTMGNEELRAKRKQEVKYLQQLLQKADALNVKAKRLVEFQDQLAEVGKATLREALDVNPEASNDGDVNMGQITPSHSDGAKERKFAAEPNVANETFNESTLKGLVSETSSMDVESPNDASAPNNADDEDVISDEHDEIKAMQDEHESKTREFYNKQHKRQARQLQEEEHDSENKSHEPPSSSHRSMNIRGGIRAPARDQQPRSEEPSEPDIQIKELPRAYVLVVRDPLIRRSRVSLDGEEALLITVPGKSPIRFTLGSNINTRSITKEVVGDHMQLVLPKLPPMHMRTGRTFAENPRFARGWGRDDFWSRF